MQEDYEEVSTIPGDVEISSDNYLETAKWILDPKTDIPEELRRELWWNLVGKSSRIGNIRDFELPWFDRSFEYIYELADYGLLDYAMSQVGRVLHALNISVSVDGFQMRIGLTGGVSRTETTHKVPVQPYRKKGGLMSFLTKKKGDEEE